MHDHNVVRYQRSQTFDFTGSHGVEPSLAESSNGGSYIIAVWFWKGIHEELLFGSALANLFSSAKMILKRAVYELSKPVTQEIKASPDEDTFQHLFPSRFERPVC